MQARAFAGSEFTRVFSFLPDQNLAAILVVPGGKRPCVSSGPTIEYPKPWPAASCFFAIGAQIGP